MAQNKFQERQAIRIKTSNLVNIRANKVPELDKIVLEIRSIKSRLDYDTFQVARFGYKCWMRVYRSKPQTERLKFLRDYLKAYEDDRKRI